MLNCANEDWQKKATAQIAKVILYPFRIATGILVTKYFFSCIRLFAFFIAVTPVYISRLAYQCSIF